MLRIRISGYILSLSIILIFISPVSHLNAQNEFAGNIRIIKEKYPDVQFPVIDGDFPLVYEPDPEKPNTWFVNDHCLIQDDQGRIHYFGIENPYPSTKEAWEWVKNEIEIGGVTYMSSCGIEDPQGLNRSGLWISQIRWLSP